MSINIAYGPIGAALGLANVAGAGQGFLVQSQRDMQALQMQNQMQGTINSNDANLIQMAMARDELNARVQQQAQQQQQESIYRQAQQQLNQQQFSEQQMRDNQQSQQFQQEQKTREQQANDLAQQRAQSLADKKDHDQWLTTLTQDQLNTVNSGGHLDNGDNSALAQQRAQTEGAYKQAEMLKSQIAMFDKQLDPLNNLSDSDRAAVMNQRKVASDKFNATVDGINAATGSRATPQQQAPARAGGIPSAALPDAEKAKLLLAVSQKLGLPPDDPRVIKAAAAAAPAYAANMQQGVQFAQQQQQVAAGRNKLAQQNAVNQADVNKQQFNDKVWSDWVQGQGMTYPN